jgi:hypothetical protein
LVVIVAWLLAGLGSVVVALTVALSRSEPPRCSKFHTAKWNVAEAPEARLALVQVIVPLLSTGGVVHDQPAGRPISSERTPAGNVSVNCTPLAAAGPWLVSVAV